MALKFTCYDCKESIILIYLKVGEVFQCPKCRCGGIVPEDAVETDEIHTILQKKSASEVPVEQIIKKNIPIQNPDYPNIKEAIYLLLGYLLLTLGVSFLLGFVVGFVAAITGGTTTIIPKLEIITNVVILLFVLKYAGLKSKIELSNFFPLKRLPLSLIFYMSISVIGLHILLVTLGEVFELIVPAPAFLDELFLEELSNPITGLFYLVLMGPITEEVIDRGIILRGFLRHYSNRKAIVLSAFLFGLMHLNPWQFVIAFPLGILFGWWYLNTKSLIPSLFGHILVNGLIFGTFQLLTLKGMSHEEIMEIGILPDLLWINIFGFIFFILGTWLTAKAFKKNSIANNLP